jgi:hypothetical protein
MGPLMSRAKLPHTHLSLLQRVETSDVMSPLLAAGYFLLSVVSTEAADMMLSDKGKGEHYLGHACFVR